MKTTTKPKPQDWISVVTGDAGDSARSNVMHPDAVTVMVGDQELIMDLSGLSPLRYMTIIAHLMDGDADKAATVYFAVANRRAK